jgi:hypothetical protein
VFLFVAERGVDQLYYVLPQAFLLSSDYSRIYDIIYLFSLLDSNKIAKNIVYGLNRFTS